MRSGPSSTPGDRAVRFIGNLTLTDDFAGQPFALRPWQEHRIIRPLFGTLGPDGRRQYRRCFLGIPRKNAKTQIASAIGTYGLHGTGREGEEILCAASDRPQASHLFRKVAAMIEASDFLRKRSRIYYSARRIEARKGGNFLQVVSADARRQHGANPSILLFDELHTQPNRELYDALTSAFGARSEPLTILISTAGNRRDTLCFEEWSYARKVRDGLIDDPEYLPVIFEADEADDWTDERIWHKAMPALGDFCNLAFIRSEFKKALEVPSEESKFRQLYLDQWVASFGKWLRRGAWDECGEKWRSWGPDADLADLEGRPCYAGLDLSNVSDITAFVLVFPMDDGSYRVLCWFWIPRFYAEECDRKRNTRYVQWARAGLVNLTDGMVIDDELVLREILGDPEAGTPGIRDRFDIKTVRFDEWNCARIAAKLLDAGMKAEKMRQGTVSMNEPVKYLDVLIARGLMHHGDNPLLNWQADNAVTSKDSHGNIKLDKVNSADKIDGVVSMVMGLAGAMAAKPVVEPRVIIVSRGA